MKNELRNRNINIAGVINFDAGVFSSSMEGTVPERGAAVKETEIIVDAILSEACSPVL